MRIRPVTLILLALLAVVALILPVLSQDPLHQGDLLEGALKSPSAGHWLGTDQFARDVLARIAHGARTTLGMAIGAVIGSALIGVPVGAIAGLAPGPMAFGMSRVIDLALAMPRVIVMLVLVAALGAVTPLTLTLLLALTGWPSLARLTRAEAMRTAKLPFVTAARAIGSTQLRTALVHILPAALPTVLVATTLGLADVMLLEAGLSFLGLGVRPPAPTWGGMLLEARSHIAAAPWLVLAPGSALALAMAAATSLGDDLDRWVRRP